MDNDHDGNKRDRYRNVEKYLMEAIIDCNKEELKIEKQIGVKEDRTEETDEKVDELIEKKKGLVELRTNMESLLPYAMKMAVFESLATTPISYYSHPVQMFPKNNNEKNDDKEEEDDEMPPLVDNDGVEYHDETSSLFQID